MSNPAETAIHRFGGLTALAKALGHRNVTTVQGWRERGRIPAGQHAAVLMAALRIGVHLSPEELARADQVRTVITGVDRVRSAIAAAYAGKVA